MGSAAYQLLVIVRYKVTNFHVIIPADRQKRHYLYRLVRLRSPDRRATAKAMELIFASYPALI